MNIIKPTIRIASVALTMLTAGNVKAADAAQEWQKGPSDAWFVKWDEAAAEAKKTGKPIFVLKTGSDWCGWCIRLRKNVLSKPEFEAFAKKNLVLLYLDSPSKTPLCAEQKKHNQEVSRKLSLGGGVPNASVVTADGKKLGAIGGGGLGLEDYLKKLEGIIGKGSKKSGAGATSDSSRKVKADGDAATGVRPQGDVKLPVAMMPKEGLMAFFDYNDGAAVNGGYGVAAIHRQDVEYKDGVAVFNGKYQYRGGEDVVLPDFNYDHFTVAFSFKPDEAKEMFRIGQDSHGIFEIYLSSWRGEHLNVSFPHMQNVEAPVAIGHWNWIVVSFDIKKRLASVIVNGRSPVERLLPEDFYWSIPSDGIAGDKYRRIHFGNANRGIRYSGAIDDLMVYDRALTQKEMVNVFKGVPAKGSETPVASSVSGLKFPKPKLTEGKWTLARMPEVSQYWNGVIATKGMTLGVRMEDEGIALPPIGQLRNEIIDLSLPIVDEKGEACAIYAIGNRSNGGVYCANGSGTKVVKLPTTLRELRSQALSGCLQLEEIQLPKSLESIGDKAFYTCIKLKSIVIPENVREIGANAFANCGCLTKLEIRSKSVTVAKDAFSGSTPVGVEMPQEKWTTGPVTREIKGDPKFEYAKEGRMVEPLFSFGYGDIRLGAKHGDIGGWGSTTMKGHPDWGKFDLSFIKLGEGRLAGVTLKWRKKEATEGSLDAAKDMAKELVALIEAKVEGKVFAPLCLPESEWPEYGDKGSHYADYSKLKSIGSSKTEVNGYTVKVDVYGGTKDVNVAVVITIVDTYMYKAWGMTPKI